MMTIDFTPADVRLLTPPLVGTLGRSEIEYSAALVIRALQIAGEGWIPLEARRVGEILIAEIDAKSEPIASWNRNPFLRQDFPGLIAAGYAVKSSDGAFLELTPSCLEKIRRWVSPTRPGVL